jgi:hypothetical protein
MAQAVHFAPLALELRVLTQPLKRWAISIQFRFAELENDFCSKAMLPKACRSGPPIDREQKRFSQV